MEDRAEPPRISPILTLMGVVWALLVLALLLTFWQGPYLFTLCSSFRAHWVLLSLLVGFPLAFFYPHRKRWTFVALPLAISMTLMSYVIPRPLRLDPDKSIGITIAIANVYSGNHDLSRLRRWLEIEGPDVLAVVEVSEAQRAQLDGLPFQYKSLHPRQSNFGLALLSQRAPNEVVLLEGETPFPSLLATWPEYRVLVTHPIPPISAEAREVGDAQISRLLAAVRDSSPLPLLVVGDLNATGWDRRLEPLKEAGLREARLGHGLLPTWPADRPMLGIPIDHIYIPEGWDSRSCRRGPYIGSDHFPLIADLARSFP